MKLTVEVDGYKFVVQKTSDFWVYLVTCSELNIHVNVASHGAMTGKGKNKHKSKIRSAIEQYKNLNTVA